MIEADKKGRRIVLKSNVPIAGLKATVPGAYLSTTGRWTVPLSIESYRLLHEKYGSRLQPSTELRRWLTTAQGNRTYLRSLSRARSARLTVLPRVAPKLYTAMRSRRYQLVGTRFIADSTGVLVADDPGLGKTLMAMGGLLEGETSGPYLIVAPKTAAISVWEKEIKRWLPHPHTVITMPETQARRSKTLRLARYTAHTWVIVHPEMLLTRVFLTCAECGKRQAKPRRRTSMLSCGHMKSRKTKVETVHSYPMLFDMKWGAVIVDESHETLIRRGSGKTQRRTGLDLIPVREDGKRIPMSGTPMNDKPEWLWGTLNWIDPKTYSAYNRWAELFFDIGGGYTGRDVGELRSDREKLMWRSLDAICLRRTKAEVAKDLPPKAYVGTPLDEHDESSPVGIWLPMVPKQATAYEQMLETSVASLSSGRLEAVTALAELTRLKQFACSYGDIEERQGYVPCYRVDCDGCSEERHLETILKFIPTLPSNKFDWTVGSLEEWGFPRHQSSKVVIVSFFTSLLEVFAEQIEQHFRTKPGKRLTTLLTGKVTTARRAQAIDRFNRRDCEQIMLLNVKAGGTAITIDTADRMIFLSETRIPSQQTQAEDRIHRVSNPRHCEYFYLRSIDTVDVGTALVNAEMAAQNHRLLDGRRGVEYLRQIIRLST